MAKVSVIVPAAGAGERFGGAENKIFKRIKGKAVFIRTLEVFTSRADVCQTQLVVAKEDMDELKRRFGETIGSMGVQLVTGGATRSESVRNALARVFDEADLVCVHDAVRPCISPIWVDAVFAEADRTGAAILAYPVHGTLKKVADGGTIEATIPREGLWEAQTPQVFATSILRQAYATGGDATDDAALVEAMGQAVSVVMGDARNIKITTPADLALAEAVIDTLPKPKPAGPSHPFKEARW